MKCAIYACLFLAVCWSAVNADGHSDPYNQLEGKCGCCPLPCCCVCVEQTEVVEGTTTEPQTTTTPEIICDTKINLAFLVDNSASIREANLPIVQDWLNRILNRFQKGGTNIVQTALVLFSTNSTIMWGYDDPASIDKSIAADIISNITLDFFTNMSDGIRELLTLFDASKGFDDSIPTAVMVFSDGRSTRKERKLAGLVDDLKAVVDTIAVVGVTDKIAGDQLEMISTSPGFLFSDDFEGLFAILNDLVLEICPDPIIVTEAPTPPPPSSVVVVGEECFCCCPSPYGPNYYR